MMGYAVLIFLYLFGGSITYFVSKFYGWDEILDGQIAPPFELFLLLWPIGMLIMIVIQLIIFFGTKFIELGNSISNLGKQRRLKIEEQKRSRISDQDELEASFKELEAEENRKHIPPRSYHKG